MPTAPLAATAVVVLRGFVAGRSLPAVLALALAFFGLGILLGDASLAQEGRVESNLAWVLAEVSGWLLAIVYGAGLVGSRGVLGPFALARPVSAGTLLAGRFLGLAAGLLLYVGLVSVMLAGWLFVAYGAGVATVFGMGWLLGLRLVVILAVATLLSVLARPTLAAALAALVSLSGWLAGSLTATEGPATLKPVTWLAVVLLPDLPALDTPMVGLPEGFHEVGLELLGPTLYAAFYAGAMLAAAVTVFPWRARRPARRIS